LTLTLISCPETLAADPIRRGCAARESTGCDCDRRGSQEVSRRHNGPSYISADPHDTQWPLLKQLEHASMPRSPILSATRSIATSSATQRSSGSHSSLHYPPFIPRDRIQCVAPVHRCEDLGEEQLGRHRMGAMSSAIIRGSETARGSQGFRPRGPKPRAKAGLYQPWEANRSLAHR